MKKEKIRMKQAKNQKCATNKKEKTKMRDK